MVDPEESGSKKSSLTGMVKKMVELGVVERAEGHGKNAVRITDLGRKLSQHLTEFDIGGPWETVEKCESFIRGKTAE